MVGGEETKMTKVFAWRWVPALACAGLLVSGCSVKPTNAKLEQGLNLYFAGHEECLFPQGMRFPYEVTPGPAAKAEEEKFDAMHSVGLLNELKDLSMHVERYSLTPLGERVAPRFCYGHKEVTSVDAFTPPAKDGNVLETTVTYHAAMRDVPMWVKTDAMTKAFPEMAQDIAGPREGQIVMGTAGVGWRVR